MRAKAQPDGRPGWVDGSSLQMSRNKTQLGFPREYIGNDGKITCGELERRGRRISRFDSERW